MKELRDQLKGVYDSLKSLADRMENILKQMDQDIIEVDSKKPAEKTASKVAEPKPTAKKADPEKTITLLDSVYNIVKESRKGITIEEIKEKTGLDGRKLSNTLYKLTRKGRIEAKERGVYVVKKK